MRSSGTLLDTGPLVAYLHARDSQHEWAVAQFATLDLPLISCEAVLTEACFLIARARLDPTRVLDAVRRGPVRLDFSLVDELTSVAALMQRYANVPMSLADACMVRLVELMDLPICTLDSDFTIYRAHGRRRLDLIMPERRSLHEP